MATRQTGVIPIIGLVVAAIGILTPIAWDHYRSKTALELQEVESSVLIDSSSTLDKLEVLYDGKHTTRIYRLRFALINTGRTPLRQEDLVVPPEIRFAPGVTILDSREERTIPPELTATTSMDTVARRIRIGFPLLNPGDAVEFSVLTTGGEPAYSAAARIVGVHQLSVTRRERVALRPVRKRSWTFYLVAIITAILLIVFLASLFQAGQEKALKKLAEQNAFAMPQSGTAAQFEQFVRAVVVPPKAEFEVAQALSFLSSLPSESELDPGQRDELNRLLYQSLHHTQYVGALIVTGFLTLVGLSYLVSAIM
jgi:hypothetical protein